MLIFVKFSQIGFRIWGLIIETEEERFGGFICRSAAGEKVISKWMYLVSGKWLLGHTNLL